MNSFFVITVMSSDLFPLNTDMDFANRELHGTKSEEYEYGRQQSCSVWIEIPAQMKKSKQENYHGGESSLHCPIFHDVWQHFAIATLQLLCTNADSQFLPVGKIVLSSGRSCVTSPFCD